MKTALLIAAAAGTAGYLTLMPCADGPCEGVVTTICTITPPARTPSTTTGVDATAPVVSSQLVADPVRGEYVEARSASVFAGACHTGSEAASQGRQALFAWGIEAGSHAGVDLGGVRLVAAVSGEANLDAEGPRRAVLFVDAPDGPEQAAAAEAWVAAEHGDALGERVAVERTAVGFERDGHAFAVSVDGVLRLAGEALADGSCCTMTEERYYEPLAAEAGAVVGVPSVCAFEGAAGLPAWRFEDANSAFVTRFSSASACDGLATDAPATGACEPAAWSACDLPPAAPCGVPSRTALD